MHVNVREDSLLAVLAYLFALDVEDQAFVFEHSGHAFNRVGKDVNVDVGALPHVSGHRAADQPRTERAQ